MSLKFKLFGQHPELVYGFSEKGDGGMSRALNYHSDVIGCQNRQKFLAKHGINTYRVKVAGLVHSANVAKVGRNSKLQIIPDVDGLVTDDKGSYLTVTTADCFPVFFYDPVTHTVALIHAGWRGIVQGITTNAIKQLREYFDVNPENLKVGIGPGIQADHFEIKEDILPQFAMYQQYIYHRSNKIYVHLPGIITHHLLKDGLKLGNIEISGECTFCLKDKYFSARRDKQLNVMMAVVGIKS